MEVKLDLLSKGQNFLHKLNLKFGSKLRNYFPAIKVVLWNQEHSC